MSGKVFYLTTPIYYVNAAPHLGHAYTTIVGDALCRYRRLAGEEVYFLTGTDEHGDKIAQAAARAGETPQAYADRIASAFRETWARLGITNDDFIRTTEARHKKIVQQILQQLYDSGEIYFGEYGGRYCYGCERFYTEKELVDGVCPDHRVAPAFIKEQNYFFRMSRYQEWLVRYIKEHPDLIRPERYRNEVLGFLQDPLEDLCISRPKARLHWGIPLPFDDNYVTYVWFDALINYASALGFPDGELYKKFWPHVQHLIGKDILKPHGVYWPCMLKAAGIPIYQHLNVHGYWGLGGGKMSKSVGNVVEALQLADTYGSDAFRYFVLREMPFGLDADFSEEALVARLNAELANDLGNLVSRAITMIVNFARGVVPRPETEEDSDRQVREALARCLDDVRAAMDEFAFQQALVAIWGFIGSVNRYIDTQAPWAMAKDPAKAERLRTVLYTLAESLRALSVLLAPFLPQAAAAIARQIGQEEVAPSLSTLERWWGIPAGTRVQKGPALFPRMEGREKAPARAPKPGRQVPPAEPLASIEEFGRIDLRVAEILKAEPVEKSEKLLRLEVRVGGETRTLVAGIAKAYAHDELVGKKVVIVANLQPATLMGITSQGMILAASEGDTLSLLTLDRDIAPGAKVK